MTILGYVLDSFLGCVEEPSISERGSVRKDWTEKGMSFKNRVMQVLTHV